jgi:hypothetical protein
MAWSSFGRQRTHQSQTRTLSARPLRNSGPWAFWVGDFDTNCVRRPGPSDTEEDPLVSFDQALTDWFMFADKVLDLNLPGQSRNAVDYSSFELN